MEGLDPPTMMVGVPGENTKDCVRGLCRDTRPSKYLLDLASTMIKLEGLAVSYRCGWPFGLYGGQGSTCLPIGFRVARSAPSGISFD